MSHFTQLVKLSLTRPYGPSKALAQPSLQPAYIMSAMTAWHTLHFTVRFSLVSELCLWFTGHFVAPLVKSYNIRAGHFHYCSGDYWELCCCSDSCPAWVQRRANFGWLMVLLGSQVKCYSVKCYIFKMIGEASSSCNLKWTIREYCTKDFLHVSSFLRIIEKFSLHWN